MIRKIIQIDEEKCTGCKVCVDACHEGAIGLAGGKAKLIREDFCDGMGDCLPACPVGAISFLEQEVPESAWRGKAPSAEEKVPAPEQTDGKLPASRKGTVDSLFNWPIQIKLCPVNARCFEGANLVIAADCTGYAYAAFHEEWGQGRTLLIGCPKLDGVDYSLKLREIFRLNNIQNITVLRMQVPCCAGLEAAVKRALSESGKQIPTKAVTISVDGKVVERSEFS